MTGQVGSTTAVEAFDGKDTWVEFGIGANLNIIPTTYVRADVERTEGAASTKTGVPQLAFVTRSDDGCALMSLMIS